MFPIFFTYSAVKVKITKETKPERYGISTKTFPSAGFQ